jgi:F0F1-type ATP synthase membrane subunit b/b'
MDIFQQIGELFLEAVPTLIIVLLLYVFLRWAFWGPIQKAMAERSARIEGARAEAARAEAEARQALDAYNEALKKVRAEIYAQQEAARQAVLEDRAKLLKAMRARALEEVAASKKKLAAEFETARADLERQAPELAAQIARAVLENPSPLRGGAPR